MSTTELSEPAVDAPAEQAPDKRRRLGHGGPLSVAILIAVVVALVVAIGLSVYPGDKPPAPVAHAPVIPPTPALTPVPIGQSSPGCFDPRSALDELVVCAGDLQGRWAYDGGVLQTAGRGVPACVTPVAGEPIAWVNLSSITLHLREQVSRLASPSVALAAVTDAQTAGTSALCTNLLGPDRVAVTSQPLSVPPGARAAAAWNIPSEGRMWTMVLVSVDRAVLRLDIATLGTPGPPSTDDVQAMADASVLRYLAATAPKPTSASAPSPAS